VWGTCVTRECAKIVTKIVRTKLQTSCKKAFWNQEPILRLFNLQLQRCSRLELFFKVDNQYYCSKNVLGYSWRCKLLQRWRSKLLQRWRCKLLQRWRCKLLQRWRCNSQL
jgi:hypothetical protein